MFINFDLVHVTRTGVEILGENVLAPSWGETKVRRFSFLTGDQQSVKDLRDTPKSIFSPFFVINNIWSYLLCLPYWKRAKNVSGSLVIYGSNAYVSSYLRMYPFSRVWFLLKAGANERQEVDVLPEVIQTRIYTILIKKNKPVVYGLNAWCQQH